VIVILEEVDLPYFIASATMAGIALLLTGAYSASAALGSAMGGRTTAAIEEQDAKDRKAKAQAKWDAAKAQLDQLNSAKPGAELQSLIDNAKADLAKLPATRSIAELEALTKRGCPARVRLDGQAKAVCQKYDVELGRAWGRSRLTSRIAELTTEIGQAEQRRAQQREKAQGVMSAAEGELAAHGSSRLANSDAVALATYLQALGLSIDAERVNKLLVLLAVLVIECGGGLALAVGMALSDGPLSERERGPANGARIVCTPPLAQENVKARQVPVIPGASATAGGWQQGEAPARHKLLQMVGDAAGVLRTSERALGSRLGISSTRARQLLSELAAAGAIKLRVIDRYNDHAAGGGQGVSVSSCCVAHLSAAKA
jgi:hypothetical protein